MPTLKSNMNTYIPTYYHTRNRPCSTCSDLAIAGTYHPCTHPRSTAIVRYRLARTDMCFRHHPSSFRVCQRAVLFSLAADGAVRNCRHCFGSLVRIRIEPGISYIAQWVHSPCTLLSRWSILHSYCCTTPLRTIFGVCEIYRTHCVPVTQLVVMPRAWST